MCGRVQVTVNKDTQVTNNVDRVTLTAATDSGWLGSCDNLRLTSLMIWIQYDNVTDRHRQTPADSKARAYA